MNIENILGNQDEMPQGPGKIGTTYTHETNKIDGIKKRIEEIKNLLSKGGNERQIIIDSLKEQRKLEDELERLESES